ncbi:MAG TPA: tripartite tricarboxylate transporter TctB family protein [Burkholderiales bacterium]|nr:tripartite tricarboxylate transporter TctB family protein [Burkholderiales bacterium]
MHRTDLAAALLILAGCGAVYYATTTFDEVSPLFADNIGPAWFPRLMLWSIAVLALALPFEHRFVAGGRRRLDEERSDRVKRITFLTAVLLFIVVAAIGLLGMALAMVLVSALLPLLWGERRYRVLVPFALLFPAAVALLFSQVLRIYFEPGRFGFAFG